MPEISRFFGIIIRMYYRDHMPPHFHAHYGEYQAEITIETLEMLKGKLLNVCWDWFWNGQCCIVMN